ncbi:hypothetical protein DAPPUDRAFT_234435 [Daphnia pulex]|uniref:Uncharacterized protein n=1 Tax=Daphnia pulex TaxID=6669 RepID=E9FWL6_DAPPU|nr:hypothetical protein DAPPUDRAFT_234435 [Daphnia pulex]|eukprot:EFX87916.1 hypothetical protein DAPPUDRAFT_234435 [Daphnia pulex]
MKISVCFLEKSTQDSTEILELMLIILHDGRGTSTYVRLHLNLPDVRSSSFTASVMQRKRREDGHQNVAVNPYAATPLFSPSSFARAALFGLVVLQAAGSESRQAQNLPQGACFRQCTIVPPFQHGLVSNGKSHLVMDPSDVARRVVEINLRVVWRGSQRINN